MEFGKTSRIGPSSALILQNPCHRFPVPGDVIGHASENFHVSQYLKPLSMRPEEQPEAPSAPWRVASAFTMGAVGLLCKGFLSGLSKVETHGMEDFLKLLDEREEVGNRERGLITGMRNIRKAQYMI
jgi:hypothetical protein